MNPHMDPDAPDHTNCSKFYLEEMPGGNIYMKACWDQTNVREIAKVLRKVADGLDEMPEDTHGPGVKPV
jgi:hypothetical protein